MLFLSFFLFAGQIMGPVPISISLGGVTTEYSSCWKKPPVDAVSLVPEGPNSNEDANEIFKALEVAKKEVEKFLPYKPENAGEEKINEQFEIISVFKNFYRVIKNDEPEKTTYTVMVKKARTTLIRNTIMAEALKIYLGRNKIFKDAKETVFAEVHTPSPVIFDEPKVKTPTTNNAGGPVISSQSNVETNKMQTPPQQTLKPDENLPQTEVTLVGVTSTTNNGDPVTFTNRPQTPPQQTLKRNEDLPPTEAKLVESTPTTPTATKKGDDNFQEERQPTNQESGVLGQGRDMLTRFSQTCCWLTSNGVSYWGPPLVAIGCAVYWHSYSPLPQLRKILGF